MAIKGYQSFAAAPNLDNGIIPTNVVYELDNIIFNLSKVEAALVASFEAGVGSSMEGEDFMAHQNTRVLVSLKGEKPKYVKLQAASLDELNDKIVSTYVKSGRIWEFVKHSEAAEPAQQQQHGKAPLLKDYLNEWLYVFKAKKLKPTSIKFYATMAKDHIIPGLGDKRLDEITVTDIQAFLDERAYLSKKYLTEMKVFLSSLYKDAMEDKLVDNNPATSRKLSIPSEKVKVVHALQLEDFQDIAANLYRLDVRQRTLLGLMMYTGMRRGEVLGLRWEDIDWEKKTINVTRNVTLAQNTPIITTTKSENGIRTIPITSALETILKENSEQVGFVVSAKADKESPLSHTMYNRMWQSISKKIDLHGASAHVFRHTFLTLIASTGADPKTIQALAGHGDIQITMNRYVDPSKQNLLKATETLESLLFSDDKVKDTASAEPIAS